jgi:hypothetical protein
VWGGGQVITTNTAEIPTGSLPGTGLHYGVAGSNGFGTSGDPSKGGTGINLFADPNAAQALFRPIQLSTDQRSGRGNPLRGLGFWNMDVSLGKSTSVTERVAVRYSFDFFNVFNHPNLANPGALTVNSNTGSFGVISTQFIPPNRTNGARWIEFGLRVEF